MMNVITVPAVRAIAALLLGSAWLLPCGQWMAAQTGIATVPVMTQVAKPPEDLPAFEVASIKPNKSGSMMVEVRITEDGVLISGLALHMLLRESFGVANNRLFGEPGWVASARYDIQAKVDAADVPRLKQATLQQRWAMMVPLLEERFGLKFHHETRKVAVYMLVVANGGPKLKESVPDETSANWETGPDGKGGPGTFRMGRGFMTVQAAPVSTFVRHLALQLGATVVDRTGLPGKYDFNLHWGPDLQLGDGMPQPPGIAPKGDGPPSLKTPGPSLFTALKEQLGLKLEEQKEPVDVIVIDHIEPPSPN